MDVPVPPNSIPMRGGMGPFSYIDVCAMVTLVKVRENPRPADRDGWYGTPRARWRGPRTGARLRADGVEASDGPPERPPEDGAREGHGP